ncbi:MAG: BrnT family toxin [Gemmatimonadaceae bacterium]|nr:BrnT family toxin [Gemmatimonadaceae bacterium]
MTYDWDPAKAAENRRKHGVELADAVGVFEDPYALTRTDVEHGEERFVTLGRDFLDRLLVVVWTLDRDVFRLISARRATTRERRQYAEDSDA